MASCKLTLGIVFLLAAGLCLATALALPKRTKLIKDCAPVMEAGTAPAGLISATVGIALNSNSLGDKRIRGRTRKAH
jgi:hypothetical protein